MISHEHKFIFVHINKCGGTTVETALKKYGGEFMHKRDKLGSCGAKDVKYTNHLKHVTAEQYSTTEYWKDYFKFAFVRNPFEKELSDYFFYQKNYDLRNPHGRRENFKDTFIKYLKELHLEWWHTNQFEWLISQNKKMELDFIGRVENFQEDFDYVCDKIGIPRQQLSRKNKTNHKHYTEYYDDKTRKIVAEKYAKDIEYFGYKFGE